jgi:hypothetical protein
MNGNGMGPMNDGRGWCSNPNYTGFGGRGRGLGRGMGFGPGRGFNRVGQAQSFGQGQGMGRGVGFNRGFGQGFAQGRGMGPGRGMGFNNGAPGYGNRVARGLSPNENNSRMPYGGWGGGWTAPADKSEEN